MQANIQNTSNKSATLPTLRETSMTDDLINHLNICVIELDEQLRLTFLNAAAQVCWKFQANRRETSIGDIFQFAAEVETILQDALKTGQVFTGRKVKLERLAAPVLHATTALPLFEPIPARTPSSSYIRWTDILESTGTRTSPHNTPSAGSWFGDWLTRSRTHWVASGVRLNFWSESSLPRS